MKQSTKEYYSKKITETVPEYFFIYDLEIEKIIYLTDSFRRFRFTKEGTEMDQLRDTIHKEYLEIFDKIFKELDGGKLWQDEDLKIQKSEKDVKWINITTYPIDSDKAKKVAGHVLDITKRNRSLEEIKSEAANLEDIIHILAHDLRGPIGSIMNILEIQNDALRDENIKDAKSYSEFAARVSRQLDTTVKSMIELVELKSNKFGLTQSNTLINSLIASVLDDYSLDLESKKIELVKHIPEKEIKAEVDPVKFRLVLQNIISNAIKFTDEKGRVEIYLDESDQEFTVRITDNGLGIPEDQQENIFEKFTKFKRKGIRGEKSVGLGLSISKKIVELHKGNLEVESEEGKGSTFTINIPKA
ncbi:MAG: sensor histidine kinase [Candidatus Cyclobacteriaceae bacterium M2_1C_046]